MHMAKKQRENICKMKSKGDKGMDAMVEVKNLSKTYDGKNMVLDKFSYIFDKGRFYAIIVTHDPVITGKCERTIHIVDGKNTCPDGEMGI